VFQKGRSKSEPWLPSVPAYGRYWQDVPGQAGLQRCIIPLGVCRTRTIAERKCVEELEKLGVNSTQRFIEATSRTTFKEQGEIWLKSLLNRKRNPLEHTSVYSRRSALDKWIYPFLGEKYLADVNNLALKELVDRMAESLAPATIRDYASWVKDVVASAIDENGEEKFPRKWNADFIDAPRVREQKQPAVTAEGVSGILRYAGGQYQMLYALLAGCGPLRVGEALGLEIKHISADFRTLQIEQKAKCSEIQDYLKTPAGKRQVDLCGLLAEMLKDHVGPRTSGLVFPNKAGKPLDQANIKVRSLHPILNHLALPLGGFNIFRRFRRTHLTKFTDCPKELKHYWSGHAPEHVSERYIKLGQEREFRLMWAEQIGMGFELPNGIINRQSGQLIQFEKAV
jgi:integrase